MTKEKIQERIETKKAELQEVVGQYNQATQFVKQQEGRILQLQGRIAELEELAKDEGEGA